MSDDDIVSVLRSAHDLPGDWLEWAGYAGQIMDSAADEIERLRADLESTRQAWVNGDDPMCDDVCVIACKGPCGQGGTTDA